MEHTKELLRLTKYIYLLGCAFLCLSVSVCLLIYLSRTFLVGRPSRSCVCRVGTPPARGIHIKAGRTDGDS